MKIYFRHKIGTDDMTGVDCAPLTLQDSIEKTRQALIDSYIYEINSLQRRYKHLTDLAAAEAFPDKDNLVHNCVNLQVIST